MKRTSCFIAVLLLLAPPVSHGSDGETPYPPMGEESSKFRAEVVIEGLENPCGLALRPSSERDAQQEILFAESAAGRILGFNPKQPSDTREVLSGLTVDEVEKLGTRASAWSLGFVTPTKLAVYGGMKDGRNYVGVYALPAEPTHLTGEQQDHQVRVAENEAAESPRVLAGMAFGDTSAFFSAGFTKLPGQIYRSGLAANRIEVPQPLLNTAESRDSLWPTGICLSPSSRMQFLVAAFAGELSDSHDSRVVFLIPASGKVSLDLTPGLIDVVALAYSPSGQLYAVDLAWHDNKASGVYRLDDARFEGKPACRAVKIANVARPTSLLFAPDGAMYVTSWGNGENAKSGKIVKVTGEF